MSEEILTTLTPNQRDGIRYCINLGQEQPGYTFILGIFNFLLNTTTIVKKGLFLNYFSDKVKSKLDNLNERKRAGKRMLRELLKKSLKI